MKILYMGKEEASPAAGTMPKPDRIETAYRVGKGGAVSPDYVHIVFLRYATAGTRDTAGKDIHVAGYSLSMAEAKELRDALDEAIKKT